MYIIVKIKKIFSSKKKQSIGRNKNTKQKYKNGVLDKLV